MFCCTWNSQTDLKFTESIENQLNSFSLKYKSYFPLALLGKIKQIFLKCFLSPLQKVIWDSFLNVVSLIINSTITENLKKTYVTFLSWIWAIRCTFNWFHFFVSDVNELFMMGKLVLNCFELPNNKYVSFLQTFNTTFSKILLDNNQGTWLLQFMRTLWL